MMHDEKVKQTRYTTRINKRLKNYLDIFTNFVFRFPYFVLTIIAI